MDEDERTLWCGNLSEKVTEEILYELFLQGGPVQRVTIPKDRDGKQRAYGFVTYKYANSISYALHLFEGTMLFNRRISMQPRNTVESPQTESSQDNSFNLNQVLQLGHQMILQGNGYNLMFTNLNMLPSGPYQQKMNAKSHENDRSSRRVHPYHKDHNRHNNSHHRDHRSNSDHGRNNHYADNYGRRNYKNNRHSHR